MDIITKNGNKLTITDDGKTAIAADGTQYRVIGVTSSQIEAEAPNGRTAYIELDDAEVAGTIARMHLGLPRKRSSAADLAEHHRRERDYDAIMNEGYEGHNPYRDH